MNCIFTSFAASACWLDLHFLFSTTTDAPSDISVIWVSFLKLNANAVRNIATYFGEIARWSMAFARLRTSRKRILRCNKRVKVSQWLWKSKKLDSARKPSRKKLHSTRPLAWFYDSVMLIARLYSSISVSAFVINDLQHASGSPSSFCAIIAEHTLPSALIRLIKLTR